MTVFLFAFAPLTAATALLYIGPRFGSGLESNGFQAGYQRLRSPALAIILLFVPLYGLQLLLRLIDLPFTLIGLFGEALLHHYFAWFGMQSLISFVAVRRIGGLRPAEQFQVHAASAGLLLFLATIGDIVGADNVWTAHELLIRPLATMALLLVVPTALTVADTANGGGWAVLALLVSPAAAAGVSTLAEWNRPGAAVIALVLLLAGSAGTLWFLLRAPVERHVPA